MIPEHNRTSQIYVEHIARYLFAMQFVKEKVVLDIASGSGYGSEILVNEGKAKKVIGIDISKEAIKYAQEKYGSKKIEFLQGDCRDIPLKDKSVDAVVSFETIEHIEEHEQFMKEIRRVLRKTGVVVISTPNTSVYPKGNEFHKKELSRREFETLLKKNFKNVNILYQDLGLASYILDENSKKHIGYDESANKKEKSTYLVAVASDTELEEINPVSAMISYDEISNFIKSIMPQLDQKTKDLEEKSKDLAQKTKELEEIKKSKAWRTVQKYRKIKRGLKL